MLTVQPDVWRYAHAVESGDQRAKLIDYRRIGGRPTGRTYVQRFATKRRCHRSSVVGVMMKAR
jgi:hypothetical protein